MCILEGENMGRQLGLFGFLAGILFLLHPALAASRDNPVVRDVLEHFGVKALPQLAPSADETPNVSDGNAQTDALLDCYAKFQGPRLDAGNLGPPHITRSPEFGYILRADFLKRDISKPTVDRLLCWKGGFVTQNDLSVPPLDLPGSSAPDSTAKRAIAGWQARKAAEAEKIAKAQPYPSPDSAAAGQLEGIWLIGKEPDKGPCISNRYHENQIEFEFRKTGGRALIFEPADLFTAISISGIEKTGDIWTVQARVRNGGLRDFLRIRWLASDRFEMLPASEAAATRAVAMNQSPQIAYKCGAPDLSVNADLSFERLASITPPISGGGAFVAAIPGASDEDLCQGRAPKPELRLGHKWIQFELFGPVHYWVFGWGVGRVFDFVRSVEDKGNGVLVLHMQENLFKGDGWDVEASRGKSYQLTLIDHGGRIEIPELSATLVRCKATDPVSGGMRRW
jgi:hypothetical protein